MPGCRRMAWLHGWLWLLRLVGGSKRAEYPHVGSLRASWRIGMVWYGILLKYGIVILVSFSDARSSRVGVVLTSSSCQAEWQKVRVFNLPQWPMMEERGSLQPCPYIQSSQNFPCHISNNSSKCLSGSNK